MRAHITRTLTLLLAVLLLPHPANAQPVTPTTAWQIYGAPSAHSIDPAVPGTATVTIQPPAKRAEPWSSGAGIRIPGAIPAGERVTVAFWARAARPLSLTASLQGSAPDYKSFASAPLSLTPKWQLVTVSGVAPAAFAADSQSLSLQLGHADTEVTLGPVAFVRGPVDRAALTRRFANYRPSSIAVDLRIPSEPGVTLAATLHLPTGPGPFPLAVMIQGHGPNGRGGFVPLIDRLTGQGIAALEYDKRGIAGSTGTYVEDVARLTADAAAAVAAMRARRDIDPARIALVGHSQGGVVAPALAAADPRIAAIVTLGGSVGDGFPYLHRAILGQMVHAGVPKAKATPATDASIALLQARADKAPPATIAALRSAAIDRFQAAGLPRPQAEGALTMIDTPEAWAANSLRSASDLASLRIPVLAVFGEKDPLVIATTEAPAARQALSANPRARIVVLSGLSHWFQEGMVTGNEAEVAKLGPNLGSPRLVSLVGDWLQGVLAEGKR